MADDGTVCPLCAQQDWIDEAPVDVSMLHTYWRTFGSDLDVDFPDLPGFIAQRHCRCCGLHWFVPSPVGTPSFYEQLGTWPSYYRSWAWEWDIAIDILRQNDIADILEIGAGRGDFLDRAREFIPRCTGLEFNPQAVSAAQARGLDVMDITLQQTEGDRSSIVAFQVLEHLDRPTAFIVDCISKLRLGGILIVAVPNQDGFIGSLWNNFLNRPPHHITLWRKSSLETVAKIFGLELIDYRAESIKLAQYKMYLRRHLRPTLNPLGKAYNLGWRLLVSIIAPVLFPFARNGLAGEAHLAAFRRPLV